MDVKPSSTVALAMSQTLDHISRSLLKPGDRLPGERMLADSIGVSRTTIRLALHRLQKDGAIEGHPQRGWYLRNTTEVTDRSTELESFTAVALSRGFTPSSRVLNAEMRSARIEEAESLQIPPASQVVVVDRVRMLDGIPISIDKSVMVGALCESVLDADLEHASLYATLQERCGQTIHRSKCILQARKATEAQAELLAIEPGEPVLEIATTSTGLTGTILMTSHVVYRGDSYRFQAELFRTTPFT